MYEVYFCLFPYKQITKKEIIINWNVDKNNENIKKSKLKNRNVKLDYLLEFQINSMR